MMYVLIGVVCFLAGFTLASIMAAAGRGSRMEERGLFEPGKVVPIQRV